MLRNLIKMSKIIKRGIRGAAAPSAVHFLPFPLSHARKGQHMHQDTPCIPTYHYIASSTPFHSLHPFNSGLWPFPLHNCCTQQMGGRQQSNRGH